MNIHRPTVSKAHIHKVNYVLVSYSRADRAEEERCLSFSFSLMSVSVENFSKASSQARSVSAKQILSEGVC